MLIVTITASPKWLTIIFILYRNPADRDHCIQYMTAVAMLYGNLTAEHYEDEFVDHHPEIDQLREKMFCVEKVLTICEGLIFNSINYYYSPMIYYLI